eukprot:scaffold18898_cov116-Isochrysis_galbana.AAC.5
MSASQVQTVRRCLPRGAQLPSCRCCVTAHAQELGGGGGGELALKGAGALPGRGIDPSAIDVVIAGGSTSLPSYLFVCLFAKKTKLRERVEANDGAPTAPGL